MPPPGPVASSGAPKTDRGLLPVTDDEAPKALKSDTTLRLGLAAEGGLPGVFVGEEPNEGEEGVGGATDAELRRGGSRPPGVYE